MIKRTLDPAFLNGVCNHPEVRPWLGGEGPIDLSDLIHNPNNFAMVGEFGGWLAHKLEIGRYEVHTQILPEGRGEWAMEGAEISSRYMFTETDCMELVTRVPESNKAALLFSKSQGFQEIFRTPKAWPDGSDVVFLTLTFDRWKMRDKHIELEGCIFHEELEKAKRKSGSTLPTHPDDPAHDRAAGAARLMFKANNPQKAVATYNRWAQMAGYQAIELLGMTPLLINVIDACVTVRDGQMDIVRCL